MVDNDKRRIRRACRLIAMTAFAVAGVSVLAFLPATAAACARDGVPSVSADGRLAVLNRSGGSARVIPATWSPFVFADTVSHGQGVTLSENNREVARALPTSVFSHPWRWDYGDHSPFGYGTTVRHAFARPGAYRITVLAYYAAYATWEPFDLVTIRVR